MKKNYIWAITFQLWKSAIILFGILATLMLLCAELKAQTPPALAAKSTLPQTLLTGKTFSSGAAVDTVVLPIPNKVNYTLEVVAKVNSAIGRGLDIEGRNSFLEGFRVSLDAASLKATNPITSPQVLSASASAQNHTVRVAVKDDSAYVYQNGAYLYSLSVESVKDIVNGVESGQVANATYGLNIIPNWAGATGNNAGTPADYGWSLTPTSSNIFSTANSTTVGTSRYMDVNASSGGNTHTYNSATYVGRLLYIRWDGNGSTTGSTYAYPVTLEAGATYDFSLLYSYISNGSTGSSISIGIGSTTAASGRTASKSFATSGTARDLKRGDFIFTAPGSGTYYITISGPTALYSIGDLSVKKIGITPRFVLGKNYPTGAVNMEIISATFDSTGAFAPTALVTNPRQTVTLTGTAVQLPTTFNTDFVVPGKTDVHFIAENTPYSNSSIALNSNDSWLFFDNLRPATVLARMIPSITINGAAAVNNTNFRIAIYKNGTVIIPNGNLTNSAAIEVFTQPNRSGNSQTYPINAIQNNLGAFNDAIRSFKLKRGYIAVLANNTTGSGYSRTFIANDSDLTVNVMPAGLDTTVSFIRVMKWEWVSKKGKAGWNPNQINCTWWYNWGIDGSANANYDYAGIRQSSVWPGYASIISKNVNHILGFNEPDRPDQADLTVDEAFNAWTGIYQVGVRVGSPSPSNPDGSWITQFLAKCDSFNYRVDYVAIHCYWGNQTPAQWYSRLKNIYNRVKRPLWITEWNNGANWTNETWPSDVAGQQQKQLNDLKGILQVLDTASFVERYAEYDWVEAKRALVRADTLTPAGKYYAANKSDFAYDPDKAFVHNWKLVGPRLTSTIPDTNYYKVKISWKDLNGETGSQYTLERKIEGRDAGFVVLQDYTGYANDAIFRFEDSVYNKASYRVKAFGLSGTSSVYSGVLEITRDASPVAPTITGNAIASSYIQLNWVGGTNARSYNLKRSMSASGPWTTIAPRTKTTTYSDTALSPSTTYYYTISSINNAGESTNGNVISVTTPALSMPTGVLNPWVASGDSKVILTWDFQYDTKYKILRSASESGPWDTVAINVATLRYEDMSRTNGAVYYYKVIAYNPLGASPVSSSFIAKPGLGQHLHINFNEANGNRVQDEWGAYTGTFNNGVAWSTGKDSASGAVKMVKDSSSYIDLADGVVSTINDFTIATWFKMPATEVTNTRVFDFGNSTGTFMMLSPLVLINNVPNIRYKITCAAGTYDKFIPYTLPLDTWVHLVISQKDSVFKVYANGTPIYTDSSAKVKPLNMGVTTRNYIARSQWSSDPYTEHAYDDLRIYNYALNDANVANLYNETTIILPISLVSFSGKPTAQGNLLTWVVNTNSAGIRMELERSGDARNFSTIHSLTATRSATTSPFIYTDVQAKGAINYYRLKMIDVDGKVTYSPVVAIIGNTKGTTVIGVYPTIVQTNAVLSISAASQISVKIIITDTYGRSLKTLNSTLVAGSNLLNIDAAHLASGVYSITVYDAPTRLGNVRFVVSK